MSVYTLAIVDYGNERYEALYADGRLIGQAEDEKFSASELLEVIAANDIGIRPAYVDVDHDYDQEVLADHGWPETLSEIKARETSP